MSDQDQFSSSSHPVYENAAISDDFSTGQGGLLNHLFPLSRSFDVDSVIELLDICRQRLNENAEVMKVLYHRRRSMMANFHIENSARLSLPNGSAPLPFTELGFGASEIDVFQYRVPEGLSMEIPYHTETGDAAESSAYTSMKVVAQQQALAALLRNTQTNMTDTGDESLPWPEVAGYRDKRRASFTSVYAPFPQPTNSDYGHAQEIAFGSASSCPPGQTISPAALVDTSDNKDGYAKSSVEAPSRDGPTVLSVISDGIKHYRCECGYESARKGDVHHHLESLQHSERKYECSCGKKFTRYDSLNRHRKRCKVNGVMGLDCVGC